MLERKENYAAALVSQNRQVRAVNFRTNEHVQRARLNLDKYTLTIVETRRDRRC